MIRLLIVDDHEVVRTGIAELIATAPDVELVGQAADGAEALERAITESPDVILMDLEMPEMDGVEATRRLREACPGSEVVILSAYSDPDQVLSAVDAGAIGYLVKDAAPDDVLAGIRSAASGGSPLAPAAARTILAARAGTPED